MYKRNNLKKLATITIIILLSVSFFNTKEISASSNVDLLVERAKYTGTVLKWAISIEGSGDGKTRPWDQYNDAKRAYAAALNAVDKLPASKKKKYSEELEKSSALHIKRAMHYIDSITAGEKINAKKYALKTKVDSNVLDNGTESAYHELSTEIRKQAVLLDRVYGKSTRDLIRNHYKGSAEALKKSMMYPITVKMHLDQVEEIIKVDPTNNLGNELLVKVENYLPDISNQNFKSQLTKRYLAMKSTEKVELTTAEVKQTLTLEAIKRNIPPEVIKAVALQENGSLSQFKADGTPLISWDGGIGIMQVTLSPADTRFDRDRLKWDTVYNIQVGADILLGKWNYGSKRIPTINDNDSTILENWYFAIMAYNGLSAINDPTSSKGTSPYQLKVYGWMDRYAGVKPEIIKKEDILTVYEPKTNRLVFSDKMNYTTTKKTKSTQMYKNGDAVLLSSSSYLRVQPKTGVDYSIVPVGSNVTVIEGPFQDSNYVNLFSWYKVRVSETGQEGYIASLSLQ